MKEFALFAQVVLLIGFGCYIHAMTHGRSIASRPTWLIWALTASLLLFKGFLESSQFALPLAVTIATWSVYVLAAQQNRTEWSAFDISCLNGAVAGMVFWMIDPAHTTLFVCIVLLIGGLPTFVSTWKHPHSEDKTGWTIFFVACVIGALGIPHLSIADAALPLTNLAIQSVMIYLIYIRGDQVSRSCN